VVKGPGSALDGSNDVHGLVNTASRAPFAGLERSVDLPLSSHDLDKFKGAFPETVDILEVGIRKVSMK